MRARRRSQPRSAAAAALFAEIFVGRQPALPDSVNQALAALALAREPRRMTFDGSRHDAAGDAPARELMLG